MNNSQLKERLATNMLQATSFVNARTVVRLRSRETRKEYTDEEIHLYECIGLSSWESR